MRKVVISVHGIRTRGVWQKHLCPFVSERGWKYYPLDYGHHGALLLLLPWTRKKKAEWFRDQYNMIIEANPGVRPSIIVHSFGSLILASAMEKYTDLVFDKVVITGSIIRRDYPWSMVVDRSQCASILNVVCAKDLPVLLARWFAAGAGDSGRRGFVDQSRVQEALYELGGHSDSHSPDVYRRHIIPFLERPWPVSGGTSPVSCLTNVAPYQAACLAAVTYKLQYLERVEAALSGGHFRSGKPEDSPLERMPTEFIVLVPSSASDASIVGRKKLANFVTLQSISFGTEYDRTAEMDLNGALVDIPSIVNTFLSYEYMLGSQQAVTECLEYFYNVLVNMIDDPHTSFGSSIRVMRLDDYIKQWKK